MTIYSICWPITDILVLGYMLADIKTLLFKDYNTEKYAWEYSE